MVAILIIILGLVERDNLSFKLAIVLLVDGVLGLELGDGALHEAYHIGDLNGTGEYLELVGDDAGLGIVVLTHLGNADAAMASGNGVLISGKDLLIEFLTGTEAGVLYHDVLVGDEAGKLNHATGHIGYLDALTHIEDENLVAIGHRGGFHNEAASLGDGHEEAGDILMRNRNRTALGNLLAETGDNGAVGAEDVAESRCNELRFYNAIRELTIDN